MSSVQLLFALIVVLQVCDIPVAAYNDIDEDFDINENLIPKITYSLSDRQLNQLGLQKLQNRKNYEELLSKHKHYSELNPSYFASRGNPSPRHVLQEQQDGRVLSRDFEVQEEERAPKWYVAPKPVIPDLEPVKEYSLHSAPFEPTVVDESFADRKGRSDVNTGDKKFLFTLQVAGDKSPESYVCQPLASFSDPDVKPTTSAVSPYSENHAPQQSPYLDNYGAETSPQTHNNMMHQNHAFKSSNPVLDDIVSKLKSAVYSFEKEIKQDDQPTHFESNKEAEQQITQKFLRFVQQFLGSYKSKPYQPVVSVIGTSSDYSPETKISSPVEVYSQPSNAPVFTQQQTPKTSVSGTVVYPELSESLAAQLFPSSSRTSGATDFTYPLKTEQDEPMATVVQPNFSTSQLTAQNQHLISGTEDSSTNLGVSAVPRVVQSTDSYSGAEDSKHVPLVIKSSDLTKYFPSVDEQPVKKVDSDTVYTQFKWTANPPPHVTQTANGQWTVSSGQKPNAFTVTQNIPVRPSQMTPQETSHAHHNLPDFEYPVSSEVAAELPQSSYPLVRATDSTDSESSLIGERNSQRSKSPRQKVHRNRKDPEKVSAIDANSDAHQSPVSGNPSVGYPLSPQHSSDQYQTLTPSKISNPSTAGDSNNHRTFTVGTAPNTAQPLPPLAPAPVMIERLNASKFVLKHEKPYVVSYQSKPYVVDFVQKPTKS